MIAVDKILSDISTLTSTEKLQLVDKILTSLHPINKGVDINWGKEAEKRIEAHDDEQIVAIKENEVLEKYKR